MGEQINVTLRGPLTPRRVRNATAIIKMAIKAQQTHRFDVRHTTNGGLSLSLNSKD